MTNIYSKKRNNYADRQVSYRQTVLYSQYLQLQSGRCAATGQKYPTGTRKERKRKDISFLERQLSYRYYTSVCSMMLFERQHDVCVGRWLTHTQDDLSLSHTNESRKSVASATPVDTSRQEGHNHTSSFNYLGCPTILLHYIVYDHTLLLTLNKLKLNLRCFLREDGV